MDSVDLFDVNKINIEFNKNEPKKAIITKLIICLKSIDLKSLVLFSILISNFYLIYLL